MKRLSREYLLCLGKSAIMFFVIVSLLLPLGITAGSSHASSITDEPVHGGLLKQSLEAQKGVLNLKLLGVASYELTEIFHNLIRTTPGVVEARRYHFHLDPKYPQACSIEWQITFAETTPFALESEIYNRLKEITANESTVHLVNGADITLTATELEALKSIKPWQATSHSLRFIQTLTFADGREAQGPCRHHNHRRWFDCPNQGFE